jgi:hypothetical protein
VKAALTALSLALLATASFAAVEVTTNPEAQPAFAASPEIADALYRVPAPF